MKIIGFSGLPRSGKDTAAECLQKEFLFSRIAFADPMKDGLSAMFRIPRWWFDDRDKKASLVPGMRITVRELMRHFGTDVMQGAFGHRVWVDVAYRRLQEITSAPGPLAPGVVFSDVRFEHEASMVRNHGGVIVHLIRPGCERSVHESDAGVVPVHGDLELYNGGSEGDLLRLVREIPSLPLGAAVRLAGGAYLRHFYPSECVDPVVMTR
jgi:hypothetical protein